MSRPSSIAELIAVKSEPCTKGIASMKSTKESAGKPFSAEARLRPLAITARKTSGNASAKKSWPGCRTERMNARTARWPICAATITRGSRPHPRALRLGVLVARALEPVPGLGEEHVVQRRGVELEVL